MFAIRLFAAFTVASGLVSSVYGELVPGELVVTEHIPPPVAEKVIVSKPVISEHRFHRVNNEATAPITLAPDPDAAKDVKTYSAVQDFQNHSATEAITPNAKDPPPPIDRAVMRQEVTCNSGGCQTSWVPVGQQTQIAQPRRIYRRGLFGFRR